MLKLAKRKEARLLAALAAGGLMLSPALAATGQGKKRPAAVSLSFDPVSSFTPAPAKGRPSQVRVAVRARVATPPPAGSTETAAATSAVSALTPTGYNLGVAVGWRRFAVAGDVAKVSEADSALGGRETALVGISYSLNKRFTGGLAVRSDRAVDRPLSALRKGDNVSLDVGGSYSLSKHIAVTGGVRYNIERDRMTALQDDRRDSQAVYVGTAFKF